ncbi:MAG: peroxiredoxin [Firmicutes bacterium]|nr:peroxiredoxin [Alicyclobacillaceae bacterium]MCL6496842.1 peroxiredoxin [Bacillota bacterium]
MNIKEGDLFPEVVGTTYDGKTIRLEDYRGNKNVVLYFYPKDLTPGCTREAIDFDRKLGELESLDTVVIGMSVDPPGSHETFATACGLHFPLLTDEGGALAEKLGILNERQMARRTTFILDKAGRVRRIFEVGQVDGHADEVVRAVRAL